MIIDRIELTNFKKHVSRTFDFGPGSNLIVGPNYTGKSSLMEAILIGLWGNSIAPGTAAELVSDGHKDFNIKMYFGDHIVERSLKNASLARAGEEPYVRGHSSVNKAVSELLGVNKDVFMKVFASEQGAPQKLLDMEGAELQRFIEGIIGIDKLDLVMRECNRRVADCKSKTEALDYLIMPADELSATKQVVANTQKELVGTSERYRLIGDKESELREHMARLETELRDIIKGNQELDAYERGLEKITSALQGRELQPEPCIDNLIEQEKQLFNAWDEAEKVFAHQRKVNDEITAHQNRLSYINEQLDKLPRAVDTMVLKAHMELLGDELSKVERQDRERTAWARDHVYHTEQLAIQEGKLAAVPGQPDVTKAELEAACDALAASRDRLATAQKALHASICPTCRRAMDDMDPNHFRAQIAFEEATYDKCEDAVDRLRADRQATELRDSYKEKIAFHKAELERLGDGNFEKLRDLQEIRRELYEATNSYHAACNNNAIRGDLEMQRLSLTTPAGTYAELVPTTAAHEAYIKARTLRLEAYDELGRIVAANKAITLLQEQLASLVKPSVERRDAGLHEQRIADYRAHLASLDTEARAALKVIHDLEMELTPLVMKLSQHEEAYAQCAGFYAQAEDYRYIYQILTNSRAGFISKAMATIFSVATEFCKLSTNGDIEQVLFDSSIRFVEAGVTRTKNAASGAQKSLIGLGMKLGIANLVTTPFSSILLDEVGAAMSDEISLQSSLAMASLCEQSLSISHRKLDVAGTVIEL